MTSTTLTLQVDAAVNRRLEELAESTGRSRALLAAEAIDAYLDAADWQAAGVKQAIASLDRGEGIAHREVKDWVESWGSDAERPQPGKR